MEITGNWTGGLTLDWHRKFRSGDWRRTVYGNPRTASGEMVYELKFRGSGAAALSLGRSLVEVIERQALPCCLLIPIPGMPRRAWQPAAMLARVMSELLSWPLQEDVFWMRECEASTRDITSIGAKYSHLQKNLSLRKLPDPAPQAIMLVDDVISTGATFTTAIGLLEPIRNLVYVAAATQGD